jgi:hypothetical protein
MLITAVKAPGQDILLDTAEGQPIPNKQEKEIGQPLAAAALEANASQAPFVLRAKAHPAYNCHGLTFASKRSAIYADADVLRILKEDGYKQIPTRDALPGDVAIYWAGTSIEHSAIVVRAPEGLIAPDVISKWGVIGPEVIHPATNCGLCGYTVSDIRYYRMYS